MSGADRGLDPGRNLAGNSANIAVNLLPPLSQFQDRLTQIDFRVAKILKFGRTRTQVAFDLFNAFNSSAIQTQNTVNPAGQIGSEPVPRGQDYTYAVRARGRLETPDEFGQIILRANPEGSILKLRDVARIELGAQTYNQEARFNGKPCP